MRECSIYVLSKRYQYIVYSLYVRFVIRISVDTVVPIGPRAGYRFVS